jgi:hypothetical protein
MCYEVESLAWMGRASFIESLKTLKVKWNFTSKKGMLDLVDVKLSARIQDNEKVHKIWAVNKPSAWPRFGPITKHCPDEPAVDFSDDLVMLGINPKNVFSELSNI